MIYVALKVALLIEALLIRSLSLRLAKVTGFVALLGFVATAGFRGMVGTDTQSYTHIVGALMAGFSMPIEPGFVLFIGAVSTLTNEPTVVLNLFSTLFFSAIILFMVQATRRELIYLFAYFGPQYFVLYSMNGIRIGLATAFFLLFYQAWTRRRFKVAIAYGMAAFSFHFTILFAYILFFFSRRLRLDLRSIAMTMATACLVLVSLFLLQGYFLNQVELYADTETYSELSGLSIIAKMTLLLAFVGKVPIRANDRNYIIMLSISGLAVCIAVAQVSYAGLRFLDMLGWLIPILFMGSVEWERSMGKRFYAGLAVVGFSGALLVLRNIYSSAGVGASPFIPYVTLWS